MNDKNELSEKLRAYQTITIVIAVVIAVELLMLFRMIPVNTIYTGAILGGLVLFFLYLIVLCLRLIRELKDRIDR